MFGVQDYLVLCQTFSYYVFAQKTPNQPKKPTKQVNKTKQHKTKQ